ncbi:hypothetical protein [Variovorax terrae]|uniref:Hydrolase or metal-binding protein n=1 Tax=Variovorax terrae TaxID=2923278 RepID=A0A9X1W1Q2_9BURK|nr:hypothetical protein [Variovorax terrae]MCJ0766199.1 hypothetical protein [Variovorax terrae]
MLKGLALTPPEIGRIAIGHMVEKNGKRLPHKDDEFTLTTQVQTPEGWKLHPLDQALRVSPGAKLRSIPVRLLFGSPELNLRAQYSLFDRATGRPLCVGNGQTCRRATAEGVKTFPCPAPEGCELALQRGCKPYGRMNVRIGEEDELGSFVFRTTGFNSIRTLSARLSYFQAVSGDRLATLPLELRLRGKSTALSHRSPVFYVDLTVRSGMSLAEALQQARQEDEARQAAGFDQQRLDEAARQGLARGAFEESAEEGLAVVEEFYPQAQEQASSTPAPSTLADRLARKLETGGAP